MRGDVYRLKDDPRARGHEQRGVRFGIVAQSWRFDHLSTWLMVPTSTSAQRFVFRPEIEIPGHGATLALCDALTSTDHQQRLGKHAGLLSLADMQAIDLCLTRLLDLPS